MPQCVSQDGYEYCSNRRIECREPKGGIFSCVDSRAKLAIYNIQVIPNKETCLSKKFILEHTDFTQQRQKSTCADPGSITKTIVIKDYI